ncbi:MAG: KH domain-containing protein [Candidatus Woesearchaeota archaeon]
MQINIPENRVSILIGEKGKTKRLIEKLTKSKLNISNKGNITILSENLKTRDIIEAIGRGFNPKIALKLVSEDIIFDLVEINDFSKNKLRQSSLRSRVIGRNGSAKKMIETRTNTDIAVFGKTVAFIGKVEDVYLARRTIELILQGSQHGSVYRWLKDQTND